MSSEIAVSVRGLSKRYSLAHNTPQHTLASEALLHSLRTLGRKAPAEDFWALKDVSFDIHKGDVVGIIGRNGAGKSTLLKVLSRITEPTAGQIDLYGRVGSLLEVGTGFHPELTGRENIYLNGAILGMSRKEIASHFDAIVDFSGVEQFLDTPVKRYSSGMYVRLAFAVAAHLEPEILIVDEVLAVGDAEFQKKCLGKMQDVAAHGRTVIFVSHNMGAVRSLCSSVIWMQKGQVHQVGPVDVIADSYMKGSIQQSGAIVDLSAEPRPPGFGERFRLMQVSFNNGKPIVYDEPLVISIAYEAYASLEDVVLGFGISTLDGTRLMTVESNLSQSKPDQPARNINGSANLSHHKGLLRYISNGEQGVVDIEMDRFLLQPGQYSFDIGARSGENSPLDVLLSCANIEVLPATNTPGALYEGGGGVRPPATWHWNGLDGNLLAETGSEKWATLI